MTNHPPSLDSLVLLTFRTVLRILQQLPTARRRLILRPEIF